MPILRAKKVILESFSGQSGKKMWLSSRREWNLGMHFYLVKSRSAVSSGCPKPTPISWSDKSSTTLVSLCHIIPRCVFGPSCMDSKHSQPPKTRNKLKGRKEATLGPNSSNISKYVEKNLDLPCLDLEGQRINQTSHMHDLKSFWRQ